MALQCISDYRPGDEALANSPWSDDEISPAVSMADAIAELDAARATLARSDDRPGITGRLTIAGHLADAILAIEDAADTLGIKLARAA